MAEALVGWQALRAGYGTPGDYIDFVRANGDWPGLALLREQGDARLRPDLPPQDIRDWFGDRLPETLAAENANRYKTRFVASAVHDLLQPLNAARMFVSALRGRLHEDGGLRDSR